jgi:hypothetical protein
MRVRIGDRGRAVSALRPGGEVLLGGRRWPARCDDGWAEAGAEVVVVAAEAFGLVVRPAGAVPAAALANAGEAVPTDRERAEQRERREEQARAEEAGAARAAHRRDSLLFVACVLFVAIPVVAGGAWLGGEWGLKIALGVVIGVAALVYAWAHS